MSAYIRAASCISYYPTYKDDFFLEAVPMVPPSNFLFASNPDYRELLPGNIARRASHVLKMGIATGLMALKRSGRESPDAIIAGTGMGCFEDTHQFLKMLDDNNEHLLNPTPFIQSTHNTVSGQLALITKCYGYNFTFVHQNLSFEFVLEDALILLENGEAENILAGCVDELNDPLCELFSRAGHIKPAADMIAPIWESESPGYIAGEGAAFFSLGNSPGPSDLARLNGVRTFQKIDSAAQLLNEYRNFITTSAIEKPDLVLIGISGDNPTDTTLLTFREQLGIPAGYFKHLCGEFFTSSGFASWLAVKMLHEKVIPLCVTPEANLPHELNHILVVNQYQDSLYSLMSFSNAKA